MLTRHYNVWFFPTLLLTFGSAENPLVHLLFDTFGLGEPTQHALPVRQPLKVFSAGLSRTGTMSLRAAMQELGYNPWHGQDGVSNVDVVNALAHAYITGNASLFLDYLQRDGYNASVELMQGPILQQALVRYPDARVILTVRDGVDAANKWAASMQAVQHVTWHMMHGPMGVLFDIVGLLKPVRTMSCASWATMLGSDIATVAKECNGAGIETSRWAQFSDGDIDSAESHAMLVAAYESYNAAVRKIVPPERILEFNVKQGYIPLCRFLQIPQSNCPSEFPWVNEAAEMRMVGKVFAAVHYGWWMPLVLFLCMCRRCFTSKLEKKD